MLCRECLCGDSFVRVSGGAVERATASKDAARVQPRGHNEFSAREHSTTLEILQFCPTYILQHYIYILHML